MSYDFLTLPRACDHTVASERLLIAEDHRHLYSRDNPTLRMTAPVNGMSTVVLRINDVLVPRDHAVFGWEVLPDELSVAPDRRSKIVFKHAVRHRAIRIEAGYTTTAPYCPKCGGRGVMVDFEIAKDGSLRHVTQRTKLIQRCLKFLLTSTCAFYPGLTCALRSYVGKKFGPTLTSDSISSEVSSALSSLKTIQDLQARYQDLDAQEVLSEVTSVAAAQDSTDPTVIRVKVGVASSGGTDDVLNVGLRVSL